jgi:hypothetical protein
MATLNLLKAQRPFFTGNSSEENAQVLADPNPTYKLMYLDIGCVGATARDMLAFGKANWSSYVPDVSWQLACVVGEGFFVCEVSESNDFFGIFFFLFSLYLLGEGMG